MIDDLARLERLAVVLVQMMLNGDAGLHPNEPSQLSCVVGLHREGQRRPFQNLPDGIRLEGPELSWSQQIDRESLAVEHLHRLQEHAIGRSPAHEGQGRVFGSFELGIR